MTVSPKTIRRATQAWGQREADQEKAWYQESGQEEPLERRRARTRALPERLYASIDGAFVPLWTQEGKQRPVTWHEAKLVAWYRVRPGKDPKAYGVHLYGTFQAKAGFGELLWASGYAQGADQAKEVVFVCDGAAWIWDLVQTYFPQATQILDWAHAVAYVDAVAQAWVPVDVQAAEAWRTEQRTALWEGHVASVIRACEQCAEHSGLPPEVREAAARAAGYFRTHRHRMRDKAFREQGDLIESGVIESGVKQVVAGRMTVSGAH